METIVKSRNLQFSNKQMKRTARTAAAYLVGLERVKTTPQRIDVPLVSKPLPQKIHLPRGLKKSSLLF
jgi:hypothetical protein